MSTFFQSYRDLNWFLLIFCICPFLQCKRTQRFLCKRKYVWFVYATTIFYSIFIIFLSSFGIPLSTQSATEFVKILKLGRTVGNAYAIFFVIIMLLIKRQAHANYFNQLCRFDRIYNQVIEPSIKYAVINRMFWIEVIAFTVYLWCFVFILQIKFNVQRIRWNYIVFWMCEMGQQCVYVYAVLHMKNCAWNLIVRFRKIQILLGKFSAINVIDFSAEYWQLEQIANMLDILLKARDNLQSAFGSALILIFTYNLFVVALSSYIMINANVYGNDKEHQQTLYYVFYKYFCFELPLILKDFYCALYFHFLGNTVRISSLFFNFFLEQLESIKLVVEFLLS